MPESERFFGVYGVSLDNLSSSTRLAGYTEGIGVGGVLGRGRYGGREIRVRAWLTADGKDALEYGQSWLGAALAPHRCERHSDACGTSDITFLVDAVPPQTTMPDEYTALLDRMWRYVHDVGVISGPLEVETRQSNDGRTWGRLVEFTLYAEKPWVYARTKTIDFPATVPVIVQDIPYNLITYPSAEVAGGPVVIATNYSPNPSLLVDGTSWSGDVTVISGAPLGAQFSHGRVTGELAASGTQSYRARVLGSGTPMTGVARIRATHTIPLASLPAGSRPSVTIWGAMVVAGGSAGTQLQTLSGTVHWTNSAGAVMSTEDIGSTTTAFGGIVLKKAALTIPAGAVSAVLSVRGEVAWTSSADAATNTDVRLYADAAALTIP